MLPFGGSLDSVVVLVHAAIGMKCVIRRGVHVDRWSFGSDRFVVAIVDRREPYMRSSIQTEQANTSMFEHIIREEYQQKSASIDAAVDSCGLKCTSYYFELIALWSLLTV